MFGEAYFFLALFIVTKSGLTNSKIINDGAIIFPDEEDTKSEAKVPSTTPSSVDSRFFDLGSMISQMFPSFNQGNGGYPGGNSQPNSQPYPGVQNNNPQGPTQGSGWSYPNQGNFQDPSFQNQGQTNGQNSGFGNIPSNNLGNQNQQWNNLNQQTPNGQFNNNFSNQNQGSNNFGNQNQGEINQGSNWNTGTIDDFFTTPGNPGNNGDHIIKFPDDDDDDTTTIRSTTKSKGAIWGKNVPVPTTTQSNHQIFFPDITESPSQKQCVQNCPTTSEYNPVCGSNNVSYYNVGRLICARNCGINVFQARRGNCKT